MNDDSVQNDARSFMAELYAGRFRWDLIQPFPRQAAADRAIGDEAVAEAMRFARAHVDPAALDESRTLPGGLIDRLRRQGYLALQAGTELGGLGLSSFNAFRVIEAIGSWAMPVGNIIAIHNGLGPVAYLPVLPPGPLRDLVRRRVAEGAVFADADTELTGAANQARTTRATPVDGGRAYELRGEKVFIGTGGIADLLSVSATVREPDGDVVRVFFVDAQSPGFRVRHVHELVGLRGLPIAMLHLDRVRVPREHVLVASDGQWRLSPRLSAIWALGRMQIVAAASLAVAKLCLHWSREFVRRRSVDGRALSTYEAIQRVVSRSLADVFAMESLVQWGQLGAGGRCGSELRFEQAAAKNVMSVTCWRVVERTMSLLAAEGAETAASKAGRSAQPLPVERAFRDARLLRIAGGVDFQVDNFLARTRLLPSHLEAGAQLRPPEQPDGSALSEENRTHLRAVVRRTAVLAGTCRELARRYPDAGELFERERSLVLLHRIASELFTMALVLARTASLGATERPPAQALADIYCTAARRRLAAWFTELRERRHPDWAGVSDRWLSGRDDGDMLRDVLTRASPDGR